VSDHFTRLQQYLAAELPDAIKLRRQLHQNPQLSGDEGNTCEQVLAALPHPEQVLRVAGTGALLRVGGAGPAVAIRAELDALAVFETTGVPWASINIGVMHACGHDVHLAALVALARAVHKVGGPLPLLAVLQPREETYPSGALEISESGLLTQEQARATVAAHVQPLLPAGSVACTPGGVNASSDEFTITVRGSGGHAAYPHRAADPVIALAHIVVALQTLVSRGIDPMEQVVLSVTTLTAGSAANVIPDHAVARGTLRAMDGGIRRLMLSRLVEVVDLVARANGCIGGVEVTAGEPVLINDQHIARATATELQLLGLTVNDTLRSAGSDDFSYFSQQMPSLMMFVGTHGGDQQLHSSTFLPDDASVGDVARALLAGYLGACSTIRDRTDPAVSQPRSPQRVVGDVEVQRFLRLGIT